MGVAALPVSIGVAILRYRLHGIDRIDADRTVAAFADRLKDTVDLDSVRDDLSGVAYQALEPTYRYGLASRAEADCHRFRRQCLTPVGRQCPSSLFTP